MIEIATPIQSGTKGKKRNLEKKESNNQRRRIRKWKQRGCERIENNTMNRIKGCHSTSSRVGIDTASEGGNTMVEYRKKQ